eukprot:Nk52_evm54s221 gene=Nk52_evmTU54s221
MELNLTPTFEEFRKLAKQGNVVPIMDQELEDMVTPVSAYLKIAENAEYSFLLESVAGGEKIGRYSFLGTDPYEVIKTGATEKCKGDPLSHVEERLSKCKYVNIPGLPPFTGGAVGYISYDCVQYFEPRTKCTLSDPIPFLPEAMFMFCNTIVVFDHLHHILKIASHAKLFDVDVNSDDELRKAYDIAVREIKAMKKLINREDVPMPKQKPINLGYEAKSNIGKSGYEQHVKDLKKHIVAGDIIQAVPSQRLARKTDLHPFNIYRHLRSINPSPYMFYVDLKEFQLIGASPETLCKVENNVVFNHPIAGTRKRGKTKEEDDALAEELLSNEKERAEHIMLVDLGRNDVNRICKPLSVKVDALMNIERYSHVMHIVSQVSGTLRDGMSSYDAFRSIFPAGTVSGAPKVKAIELVFSLEKERRGVYAGAVGRISYDNEIDTCIALRTMYFHKDTIYLQAGGGIVFDSDPQEEYYETINKLQANVSAIAKAEKYYYDLQNAENPTQPSVKRQKKN